jgi:hypothetical protein
MLHRVVVIALIIGITPLLHAQDTTKVKPKRLRIYERTFQFSLFPGISSNGIYSGSFINKYSINLFGGLSGGNRIFELGVVTNMNLQSANGIQMAGLANIIGSNAFINLTQSEERAMIHDGFESNFKGIQLAGFLNYVRTNSEGIAFAGAFNITGFDVGGFQLAGISNIAGGNVAAAQLSSLFNFSGGNTGGLQVSALLNYTREQFAGAQVALINYAGNVMGRKSTPPTSLRGMQIGVINVSKAGEGLQVGLINFGGKFRGMQIGLINIYKKYGSKELVRMGTPIGLLNFGMRGSYFRLYYNELFPTNIEYTTGNCMNCSYVMETEMPILDDNKIYNQNALILGYDHWRKSWGFGWGFQKVLLNKFSVAPHVLNERRLITYGVRFMHLNREMELDRDFNLLTRLNVDWGRRWQGVHLFAGVSINYFLQEHAVEGSYLVNSVELFKGNHFGLGSSFWPGYSVGVHI